MGLKPDDNGGRALKATVGGSHKLVLACVQSAGDMPRSGPSRSSVAYRAQPTTRSAPPLRLVQTPGSTGRTIHVRGADRLEQPRLLRPNYGPPANIGIAEADTPAPTLEQRWNWQAKCARRRNPLPSANRPDTGSDDAVAAAT